MTPFPRSHFLAQHHRRRNHVARNMPRPPVELELGEAKVGRKFLIHLQMNLMVGSTWFLVCWLLLVCWFVGLLVLWFEGWFVVGWLVGWLVRWLVRFGPFDFYRHLNIFDLFLYMFDSD